MDCGEQDTKLFERGVMGLSSPVSFILELFLSLKVSTRAVATAAPFLDPTKATVLAGDILLRCDLRHFFD